MNYSQSVSIYYWSANHIALNISQADYAYKNGKFLVEYNEEDKIIRSEKFRALTHDSEDQKHCTSKFTPEVFKDLINTWFENKKRKIPAIIDDFWEDCSLYIREDQINLLKCLYQIMIDHQAFDDEEDLEDGYQDEEMPDNIDALKLMGIDVQSAHQRREVSLIKADEHEVLKPLIKQLREDKTPLEKKYILLNFAEHLKTHKGLGINFSDEADEESMFAKMPLKEWVLPLGNSLTFDATNDDYLENLNLFGLNAKGIDNGIRKFENPDSIVHRGFKEIYYKFFSRYHNCSGYSRFLLEQGGITAFHSTNALERFGVTDPSLYDDYMTKVLLEITQLNEKARDLMRHAEIKPEPLDSVENNYLADFKEGNSKFDSLPRAVRCAISDYNSELVDISYEHKIKLLANLVCLMHSKKINQPEVIDALQKEVRRNYEIDFDAQFSHNHSFQLKCLGTLAAISVGALAIGILAIAFPPLIPITLAGAVIITVVSALASIVSIGMFAAKAQPQKPSSNQPLSNMLEELRLDKDGGAIALI